MSRITAVLSLIFLASGCAVRVDEPRPLEPGEGQLGIDLDRTDSDDQVDVGKEGEFEAQEVPLPCWRTCTVNADQKYHCIDKKTGREASGKLPRLSTSGYGLGCTAASLDGAAKLKTVTRAWLVGKATSLKMTCASDPRFTCK
ncbi:MAG: hypothetical protein JNL79_18690 [Myxococcales bacterium]|nr:hypothetical protein [Myxococcales bacterium]